MIVFKLQELYCEWHSKKLAFNNHRSFLSALTLVEKMFRNQYDSDVTIWSPQGRLHQVEYAMEAVKQGSATVGLKSNTHAVLVALKRASSDLSSHQKKILPIDDHVGISIAGLTADARSISKWMRAEAMNSRYAHDTPLPVAK